MTLIYQGIVRNDSPDWLGWLILDMLSENPDVPEQHILEIKDQLDLEVENYQYEHQRITK